MTFTLRPLLQVSSTQAHSRTPMAVISSFEPKTTKYSLVNSGTSNKPQDQEKISVLRRNKNVPLTSACREPFEGAQIGDLRFDEDLGNGRIANSHKENLSDNSSSFRLENTTDRRRFPRSFLRH